MRTLPRPTRSATTDLDLIISRQRQPLRTEMLAARGDLLTLFTGYSSHRGWDFERTQDLSHISDTVRHALRRSYGLTYKGKALASLRGDLLSVPDGLCPYCRLIAATTIDHFLPKSRHEPFSTYPDNLVPMCQTCNTLKGTKGSARALQFFTHAYFDQLGNDHVFLTAQISVGAHNIATNFGIDFSVRIDAHILQRLAYQMTILRLVPRYQLEAIDVIHEQAQKLEIMVSDGCAITERQISLQRDASDEARKFGKNYWKAALLNAMAASDNFCDEGFRKAL